MRVACTAFLACAFASAQENARKPVTVLQESCTICHGLNRIETAKTREDWEYTVENMIGRGAKVRPDEVKSLAAYLGKYFGLPVNVNKATADELQRELEVSAEDAAAIVAARQRGWIRDWADLEKIPGLNVKKVEPVRDRIRYY